MNGKILRLLLLLGIAMMWTSGAFTPVAAAACPPAKCTDVVSACNQLCSVAAVQPLGTCTAPDGSTRNVFRIICTCLQAICYN